MAVTSFGKYRLLAELGHGGMAEVFLAIVEGPKGFGFKKLTVVKRLRKNLAEDPDFIEMFVDEARIAARLNHPNVVQTNEVDTIGGEYYIAMEYLDGQPLSRMQYKSKQNLKAGVPPMTRAAEYIVVLDMLSGLHHAHELRDFDGAPLNVVHRDVTPQNVFVTYDGQVKVVDFGIAKASGRSQETREGVIKGKLRYMSLEQASGKELDRRADIFAAGVMLWEAATAQRLWKDMEDMGVIQALLTDEISRSPKSVDPTVPDEIDRICQKALQKNREDRYATAEEFRQDLESVLSNLGILNEGRKQLGSWIQEAFAEKRVTTQKVIETQLSSAQEAGNDQTHPYKLLVLKPGEDEDAIATKQVDSDRRNSGTPDPDRGAVKKTRTPLYLSLAAIGALGIWGIAAAVSKSERERTQSQPVGTIQGIDADAPKSAAISLVVRASPPEASIEVDGRRFGNPLNVEFPKDTKKHVVRIEAKGYQPVLREELFERDLRLDVTLAPTAAEISPKREPQDARLNSTVKVKPRPKASADASTRSATSVANPVPPSGSVPVRTIDRDIFQ